MIGTHRDRRNSCQCEIGAAVLAESRSFTILGSTNLAKRHGHQSIVGRVMICHYVCEGLVMRNPPDTTSTSVLQIV